MGTEIRHLVTKNTMEDIWRYQGTRAMEKKNNKEVEEVYGEPKITKIIRAQRIR